MDRRLFKAILLLAVICIIIVACLVRLDIIISSLSFLLALFTPLFIGMGIALVLTRPYKLVRRSFAKVVKKEETNGLVKAVSIVLVYLLTLSLIALLTLFILPEIIKSISDIIEKYPDYIAGFKGFLNDIEMQFGINVSLFDKLVESFSAWFANLTSGGAEGFIQKLLDAFPQIFNVTKSIASSLLNTVIGIAFSIYLLATREFLIRNIKRITYAVLPKKGADRACEVTSLTTDTFTKYIAGQLLDATIVGLVCFLGLSVFGFPYAGLISVLVAVTNVIPFFGPFLGAVPSAILLLAIDPKWAFFFVIFIIIVQQIDGNIIVPRIVGDRTGIPAMLVMLSIIVGGGLFGVVGMLIGVPTTAVIYKIVKRATDKSLRQKNLAGLGFEPAPDAPIEKVKSDKLFRNKKRKDKGEKKDSDNSAPSDSEEKK